MYKITVWVTQCIQYLMRSIQRQRSPLAKLNIIIDIRRVRFFAVQRYIVQVEHSLR